MASIAQNSVFNYIDISGNLPSDIRPVSNPVNAYVYTKAIDLLTSGEQAGSSNINTKEHQVLLSNVIACRLKIGGADMVTKAVEDSKQVCI